MIVDGNLIVDEGIDHSVLKANNIWVRSGRIIAGSEDYPFSKKFDIVLTGNSFSKALIIDERSSTGTKSMAVTGRAEFYGKVPEVT